MSDPSTANLVGLIGSAVGFVGFLGLAWLSGVKEGTRAAIIYTGASYLLAFMYLLGYFDVGFLTRSDGYVYFRPRFPIIAVALFITAWSVGTFLRHDIFWKLSVMTALAAFALVLFLGGFATMAMGRWSAFGFAAAALILAAVFVWMYRKRRRWKATLLAVLATVLLVLYLINWILGPATFVISLSLETWIFVALDFLYFLVGGAIVVLCMGNDVGCRTCGKHVCGCGYATTMASHTYGYSAVQQP